jgi:hypothetical protein
MAAIGAWLIVRGRLLRKRLTASRCQRCAYDMTALPSLTCPECGWVAKSERELRVRRGLKRVRAAGVVLLALGWVCGRAPVMREHGWPAGIPDWALARVAPVGASKWGNAAPWVDVHPSNSSASSFGVLPTPDPKYTWDWRARDALFDEIWRRFNDKTISTAAGVAYLHRQIGLDASTYKAEMPGRWALNEAGPLFRPITKFGVPTVWLTSTTPERQGLPLCLRFETKVNGKSYLLAEVCAPVDARQRAMVLDAVRDPALDRAVAQAISARLVTDGARMRLEVDDRRDGPAWDAVNTYVRARARLVIGKLEVGRAAFSLSPKSARRTGGTVTVVVVWVGTGEQLACISPESVRLELTGEPDEAFDIYAVHWGDEPRAWAGAVTVTPRVEKRADAFPPPAPKEPEELEFVYPGLNDLSGR